MLSCCWGMLPLSTHKYMIWCILNNVTPLLYTLGRLGLEEQADHLISLNIMSGTTKRSKFTVFAAVLFHTTIMCTFFQILYYPSTFPPVQWDSSSHTVLTSEVYQRRCIDCLFIFLVCIHLEFMIGQFSCISWQYSHCGMCLSSCRKYHDTCVCRGHM